MSYKCPICGKEYNTVSEVVACTQECAKKAEKIEIEKQKKLEIAKNLEAKIDETYAKLKNLINDYNSLDVNEKSIDSFLSKSSLKFDSKIGLNDNVKNIDIFSNDALDMIRTILKCDFNDWENKYKKEVSNKKGKDSELEDYLTKILGIY